MTIAWRSASRRAGQKVFFRRQTGNASGDLIKAKKMTRVGLAKIQTQLEQTFVAADDIISELKKDVKTWKNFRAFPQPYQRLRVGWIDASRHRPDVFQTRLRYFLKMTAQNKKFGMVQ